MWNLQYYQPMVLNSLVCSFIPTAITVLLTMQGKVRDRQHRAHNSWGILSNLARELSRIFATLLAACLINTIGKVRKLTVLTQLF